MDTRAREELSKFRKSSVDLAEELEALIKVAKYMRQQIEVDMTADLGFERNKIVKAIADLTMAFSKAVDARVKLDKHLTAEAEALTDEEQLEAVFGYIKSLVPKRRRAFLQECVDFHKSDSPRTEPIL